MRAEDALDRLDDPSIGEIGCERLVERDETADVPDAHLAGTFGSVFVGRGLNLPFQVLDVRFGDDVFDDGLSGQTFPQLLAGNADCSR